MSGRQSGLSLAELLVALASGLLLALAAIALLVAVRGGYRVQEEAIRLEENGRLAIETLARAVRQAGYASYAVAGAALLASPQQSAGISGLDAAGLKKGGGIEDASPDSVNGSDVLELRFMGSADGALQNCGGFAVNGATETGGYEGQSTFFVGRDSAGEPELRCRYHGENGSGTDALVPGVEAFQVLYGMDADGDGLPERFLSATAMEQLDQALLAGNVAENLGGNAAGGTTGKDSLNQRTHWKKVVALKLALLARGTQRLGEGATLDRLDLFGREYAQLHAADDPGSSILLRELPAASRDRSRKVFTATVQLRNRPGASTP
jgi:type IV pilus assembly protein PilW